MIKKDIDAPLMREQIESLIEKSIYHRNTVIQNLGFDCFWIYISNYFDKHEQDFISNSDLDYEWLFILKKEFNIIQIKISTLSKFKNLQVYFSSYQLLLKHFFNFRFQLN